MRFLLALCLLASSAYCSELFHGESVKDGFELNVDLQKYDVASVDIEMKEGECAVITAQCTVKPRSSTQCVQVKRYIGLEFQEQRQMLCNQVTETVVPPLEYDYMNEVALFRCEKTGFYRFYFNLCLGQSYGSKKTVYISHTDIAVLVIP